MKRICFSICIPRWVVLHCGEHNGIAVSRYNRYGRWYAHRSWKRRSLGRSEKNIAGRWGHYDSKGHCIGYSERTWFLAMKHFDREGNPVGSSYGRWIFYVHITQRESKAL